MINRQEIKARVSRQSWYKMGGLANPALFRKQLGRRSGWSYWVILEGEKAAINAANAQPER
jgi:hypothetical protein